MRRNGDYIYAHELGHFVCSCIDESAADKAAAQLLEDAKTQSLHSHNSRRRLKMTI